MMNREEWLGQAVDRLRPLFDKAELPLADTVHVSVGFPSAKALGKAARVVGQCWFGEQSEDGNAHVFVSPLLGDSIQVLDTLAHELLHTVTQGKKHGKGFMAAGAKIGLTEGAGTSLGAGTTLLGTLAEIVAELGEFPHSVLTPTLKEKKQTTRMLKAKCPKCGMVLRTTRQWINQSGLPLCGKETCAGARFLLDEGAEIEPTENLEPERGEDE